MKAIQLNIQEAEAENLLQVQSQSEWHGHSKLASKTKQNKEKNNSVKEIANFVLLH